jgi:hypothetical protein
MSPIDFLTEKYFSSYEEFQWQIEEKSKEKVKIFLGSLSNLKKKADNPERAVDKIKTWLRTARYSFFPANCLYLYRWLISEGWKTVEDCKIELFFNFIQEIGIPEKTINKIQWGVPLMVRDDFKNEEAFWKEQILNRFTLEGKDSPTFKELVNYFLVYHIGVKQLFAGKVIDLSETREKVVTNYMNIVNRFPEIEEIFGVAIEKEMFKVYETLKKRSNAKRQNEKRQKRP